MTTLHRRRFIQHSLATASAGWTLAPLVSRADHDAKTPPALQLAPFRFDVTPPPGHACCGGWIKPVEAVDDPLEANGFVLLGLDKPIVICVVDWTGILNEANVAWRTALAEAAGTSPERVAVHCVHQHNAPMACLETERLVAAQGDLPDVLDVEFFNRCLEHGRQVIRKAITRPRHVTHIAHGQAEVHQVASNRRVARDASGNVTKMRGSSCRDPELRALPEGLIDPWLKTIAFYDQDRKVAACHYYATHPMSYYGDGRVSSDFAGLARKRRQQEEPDCMHLYFTGCAGNIAAGKYNDGSHAMRPVLTDRVYDGIVRSEQALTPVPIQHVEWHAVEAIPPANPRFDAEALEKLIGDPKQPVSNRNRPAYTLALLQRVAKKIPLVISTLKINDACLLHLPGECFIQYQLRAQTLAPDRFVATAAYGDTGPWYIPIQEEYEHGGYEVSVAFCGPKIDDLMTQAMQRLL